jgi:hypothetical protein
MAIPLQVQIPVVCFSPLMGNKQIIKTADLKSTSIGEYRLPVPGTRYRIKLSLLCYCHKEENIERKVFQKS